MNLIFILQEWHINLFGEIVHDEPEQDQIIESSEEDLVILNERSSQAGKVFKIQKKNVIGSSDRFTNFV